MLQFNSLLVYSDNPGRLAEFYKKVFQADPGWTGGDFSGWQLGSGHFMVGPHSEVHGMSKEPQRIMFNFETTEVEQEFERIKGLGAQGIAEPYNPGEAKDMLIATLADPDGNYFQLATPMK